MGSRGSAAAQEQLPTTGTRRMAALLERIAREVNPLAAPFLSRERAGMMGERLRLMGDRDEAVDLRRQYAIELLNAGRSLDALKEFAAYEQFLLKNSPALLARNRRLLRTFQAMCYLRLAEQQNCLSNHTTDSCLLPIRGAGVHKLQDGSRSAAKVLTELLQEFPQDLSARWLLNIAHMTLGEYPDRVPPTFLIPPKVFESDYDIKRFTDVAGGVGLDVNDLSGGSIMEDFDGDGLLDVMVSSLGFDSQLRLFKNMGDGTFKERTVEAGLVGETGGLNIIQTDYNNDGAPDVLVLRGAWMRFDGKFPKSLLRNRGDGTFDDVTEAAGLLSFHPSQTATWFDYDGDGWLDLFVGNESVEPDVHPCELYRNNHDGTFTECAASAGVAKIGFVKGVASADYNNDGRPDLYLSLLRGSNVLYRNDGPAGPEESTRKWKFTDVAAVAGVTAPMNSFPCWFFDYDNDGWQDIFVSGYYISEVGDVAADYLGLPSRGERAKLYRNKGDGTFEDVSHAARIDKVLLSMGSNYGDLDNDGWLDFYVGTGNPELSTLIPNRMFRNAGGRFFQDVTTSGGFGHLQKGHGVSFGDIDNDGDQDIYEDMGGAFTGDVYRNVLFENPGHGNHWITLKLEGVKSNRAAIGARIKVIVNTGQGDRGIYKTVSTGGSFGASPLRQEIGLGDAKSIRSIEIFWPATGVIQRLPQIGMDRFYKVSEGGTQAVVWPLKTFKLASGSGAHSHGDHEHSKQGH
ncbi:MAG: CRTAC1 family protein [Pedosphaera sp.]|nr:CRTAC1 family protein [Pedosphaera sp.]